MRVSSLLRKPAYAASAALLLVATAIPLLNTKSASAYSLADHREIKMSTSQTSASATYTVSWYASAAYTVKSIVVDFCQETPIIGDSACTVPAGFSVGAGTVANQAGISGFTAGTLNSGRTLTLTKAAGSALTGGGFSGGGTAVSFDLTTATNPSTSNATFYARILTFPNDSGANSAATYTAGAPGTSTEAGGIALSTADQIVIQAKVQERLTFCVYTSAINYANCTVSTTNPVVLGDANGVLSSTNPSVSKTAKYNVTTNASNGVTIRAKGTTLTSGSNTIDPIASGNSTGAGYSAGTEQFGMCTYRDSGGGVAGLTPAAPYNHANCGTTTAGQGAGNDGSANFGFDTTTGGDNITTTYGDTIATKAAGDFSTGVLVFLGGVSNTTEPGIYQSTMTFIATGNY